MLFCRFNKIYLSVEYLGAYSCPNILPRYKTQQLYPAITCLLSNTNPLRFEDWLLIIECLIFYKGIYLTNTWFCSALQNSVSGLGQHSIISYRVLMFYTIRAFCQCFHVMWLAYYIWTLLNCQMFVDWRRVCIMSVPSGCIYICLYLIRSFYIYNIQMFLIY